MSCSEIRQHRSLNAASAIRSLVSVIGSLLFIVTLGVNNGYGQEENPDPVNELRVFYLETRVLFSVETREAAQIAGGIQLQPANMANFLNDDVFAIGANVRNINQVDLDQLSTGVNIGMIFYFSRRAQPFLPIGFYTIRAITDPDRNPQGGPLRPNQEVVQLIDATGNVAATLPLVVDLGKFIDTRAVPVNTIAVQTNSVTYQTQWNFRPNKSISLSFEVPLQISDKPGH